MKLKIKNWSRHQHFKDRRPPWIKLYRELLDDHEWHSLDPEAAKILVMLWLLASENEGILPDTKTISFRLRVQEDYVSQQIGKLNHWLETARYHDDITMISSRYQLVSATDIETPRRDRGEKSREETETENTPLPPNGVDEDEETVEVKCRDIAAEFEAFWNEYPETRKKNRYRVESAWSAHRHVLPPISELQAALCAFKASSEWKRDGGKFIPSPETWISERRWQDAPAYSPKAKPKPKSTIDEADAFLWRKETYPESLEVHPTAESFPTKNWPDSIRREYLTSKSPTHKPQLQAA